VKASYRQAASDDVVRQFRYYLVTLNAPEVAMRFPDAVRSTVEWLCRHPFGGPRCRSASPQLEDLRSWPVAGFEAIRIYYVPDEDAIRVLRILHGKRDIRRILGRERLSDE
jgi:plasmid stabilization system protein ParE